MCPACTHEALQRKKRLVSWSTLIILNSPLSINQETGVNINKTFYENLSRYWARYWNLHTWRIKATRGRLCGGDGVRRCRYHRRSRYCSRDGCCRGREGTQIVKAWFQQVILHWSRSQSHGWSQSWGSSRGSQGGGHEAWQSEIIIIHTLV